MTKRCEPPPEWRERNGWHWLGDAPVRWMSEINKWEWGEDDWLKPSQVPAGFPYNGPCLPPATVAALVEALEAADQFIRNGIELRYIRMPDPGTPDNALTTPAKVAAALALYRGEAGR